MRSLYFFTFIVLSISLPFSSCTYDIPIIDIDFDAPPATRWTGALNTVLSAHSWNETFGSLFPHIVDLAVSELPSGTLTSLANSVREHYPLYAAELDGLAHSFAHDWHHPEIDFEFLVAWAYYHELAHTNFTSSHLRSNNNNNNNNRFFFRECTGVLVMCSNGTVLHGRNMDNEPIAALRKLTLHQRIIVNGKVVAEAIDWYWSSAGFMTLFVPGVISLEENWRLRYHDVDGTSLINGLLAGALSQSWFFREAIFTRGLTDFEQITQFMIETPTPGPLYIILAGAGAGQGVVITRDPKVWYPPVQVNATSWSLVQTNYDRWLVDPIDDNRRTVAENVVFQEGQEAICAIGGLMKAMNEFPVNNEATSFTALMNPAEGIAEYFGQNTY